MASPSSGDHHVPSKNSAIQVQQERIAQVQETIEGGQTLADRDQFLAEADQTGAKLRHFAVKARANTRPLGYGDSISIQGSRASAGYGRRRLRVLLRSFSPSHVGGCLFDVDVCAGRRSAKRSPPRLGSSDGGRSAGLVRVEEQPSAHRRQGDREVEPPMSRLPARSAVLRRATAPSGTRRNNRDAVTLAGQRRDAF